MTPPASCSSSSRDGSPLFKRCDSVNRGRHLRATRRIERGRLLWCERPLLCLQSRDNLRHAFVCSGCHAFLGGPNVAMSKRFCRPAADDDDDDDQARQLAEGKQGDDLTQTPEYRVIPCRHACGHYYCSKSCESNAWNLHHCVFCTGLVESMDHPLVVFKQWAVTTNEILLLVAEWWVAQHIVAVSASSDKIPTDDDCNDAPWRKRSTNYDDFCMEPWWDVETKSLRLQPGGFVEAAELEISLRSICEDAARLLNLALRAYNADSRTDIPLPSITSLDIAKRIGACSQNAMGVRQRHPLCRDIFERDFREQWHCQVISALAEAEFIGDGDNACCEADEDIDDSGSEDEEDAKDDAGETAFIVHDGQAEEWDYSVDEIASFLSRLFIDEDGTVRDADQHKGTYEQERDATGDDLDYIFPPLDGIAMYSLICKMNHSCDPNVIVLYKRTGYGFNHPLTAFAVALKSIDEDEELTISYIDKSDTYELRQLALVNYGFSCACSRCQAELSLPAGATSSSPTSGGGYDEAHLFGDEDSVDESETDADKGIAGDADLRQIAERLDTRANYCRLGTVPLSQLSQASSFATAHATMTSLSVGDLVISEMLKSLVQGLEMKDFCLCQVVGKDLELRLFDVLRTEKSWPAAAYRVAYWCSVVSCAIAYAHECSFIEALKLLDKGIVLGLPCEDARLRGFHRYLELHGNQMYQGSCFIAGDNIVPDFSDSQYMALLNSNGLSKPIEHHVRAESAHLSYDRFYKIFASTCKAVVLRNFAKSWTATKKWRDLRWISHEHGHRIVPVEIGSMLAGTMKEDLQTIADFTAKYMPAQTCNKICNLGDAVRPASPVAYMAQHPLLNQISSLKDDLDQSPAILGPDGPTHVYIWMGTGGTRTPLHFDSYDNLFVQLVGAKYIRLYNPDQASRLYVNSKSAYGLQGNMSDVDCECEDFDSHSEAWKATYQEVLLLPGDALFIPSRTWHYVRSLSTSISVNYWF